MPEDVPQQNEGENKEREDTASQWQQLKGDLRS